MRILVVEDHEETQKLLESVLREQGHEASLVGTLAGARQCLAQHGYAGMILDWMLPDGAGVDLLRELRAGGDATPVLVLTARGEVEDRVTGLDAGADDYLRKPFAMAELQARLRSLLRRGPRLQERSVDLGDLRIELDRRRVVRAGKEVPLTRREFAILEVLLRQRGRAVSRAEMLEAVWGDEGSGAAASLEVLISRLRRKLAAGDASPIRTHRGYGYSIRHRAP